MDFVLPYDRNVGDNFATPSGEKIVPTYSLVIDKDTGKEELKETGKTNLYDYIQSSLEETLIYNIIERYNSGDVDALNKIQGFYGDVTTMPKNLAEAQQIMINAQKVFNDLPVDVRAKYNHSVSEFLSAVEKDARAKASADAQAALIAEQERKLAELQAAQNVTENINNGGAE